MLHAVPGTVFTVLRETGGIKPKPISRNRQHLTLCKREEARAGLSVKMNIKAIAQLLGLSPSTISREISHNRGRRYYKAVDANNRAKRMAKRPKLSLLELHPKLKQLVIEKLQLNWSPEQISGWLSVSFLRCERMQISHESIYKSIYVGAKKHSSLTSCPPSEVAADAS